jgi:acyl-CoA synthetase (AMP-forming)/AMP-acid ligase II
VYSGTTGVAKGVMLSHSNFVSQLLSVMTFEKEDGAIGESDIMLAFLPFYHIFGLTTLILRAVYALTPVVIMEKFDLERYCQLIQKYKVTVAPLVPPIAVLLAKSPIVPNYDLTSLRMITSGAAPLGKEHIEQLHKRIKATVRQG